MPEAQAIEPLGRVSTVDALAAALRSRILEGELGAGERLPERELTERYAVAGGREALVERREAFTQRRAA